MPTIQEVKDWIKLHPNHKRDFNVFKKTEKISFDEYMLGNYVSYIFGYKYWIDQYKILSTREVKAPVSYSSISMGPVIWCSTVKNTINSMQYGWLIGYNWLEQTKINEGLNEYEKWIHGGFNKWMPYKPSEFDISRFNEYLKFKSTL